MLLTLIFIAVTVLGFVLGFVFDESGHENLSFVCMLSGVVGIVVSVISAILIICAHAGVSERIAQNDIRYEALCKRYEIATSDYEDVSKSDVIKDIAEWNANVHSNKYWGYNPWTNWFYSRKEVDSLKYVE